MAATFANPTAVLVWNAVAEQLPEAEIDVLLAIEGRGDAQQGYLCDILDDGRPIFAYVNSGMPILGKVYAWADLPASPAAHEFNKGDA